MGEFFSVLCAVFWAAAVILFKKSGEHVSPRNLNFYKNFIAAILFSLTLLFFGISFMPEGIKLIDVVLLGLSGFLGIAVADTLFLISLNKIGASLMGIVGATYLPFVFLLSGIFFSEVISLNIILGGLLVFLAIAIPSIKFNKRKDIQSSEIVVGVLIGMFAMLLTAFGIIMIKKPFIVNYSILEKYSPLWTTYIRVLVGVAFLFPFCLIGRHRAEFVRILKPSHIWKFLIPGAVLGVYFSMFFWVAGMKYISNVSLASVLNELTIVFIIIFAAIFLRERITFRKLISVFIALAGGVLVLL